MCGSLENLIITATKISKSKFQDHSILNLKLLPRSQFFTSLTQRNIPARIAKFYNMNCYFFLDKKHNTIFLYKIHYEMKPTFTGFYFRRHSFCSSYLNYNICLCSVIMRKRQQKYTVIFYFPVIPIETKQPPSGKNN